MFDSSHIFCKGCKCCYKVLNSFPTITDAIFSYGLKSLTFSVISIMRKNRVSLKDSQTSSENYLKSCFGDYLYKLWCEPYLEQNFGTTDLPIEYVKNRFKPILLSLFTNITPHLLPHPNPIFKTRRHVSLKVVRLYSPPDCPSKVGVVTRKGNPYRSNCSSPKTFSECSLEPSLSYNLYRFLLLPTWSVLRSATLVLSLILLFLYLHRSQLRMKWLNYERWKG